MLLRSLMDVLARCITSTYPWEGMVALLRLIIAITSCPRLFRLWRALPEAFSHLQAAFTIKIVTNADVPRQLSHVWAAGVHEGEDRALADACRARVAESMHAVEDAHVGTYACPPAHPAALPPNHPTRYPPPPACPPVLLPAHPPTRSAACLPTLPPALLSASLPAHPAVV